MLKVINISFDTFCISVILPTQSA